MAQIIQNLCNQCWQGPVRDGIKNARGFSGKTSSLSSHLTHELHCRRVATVRARLAGPPCLYLCEEKHDSTPHLLPTRFSLLFPHSSAPPSRHGRHGHGARRRRVRNSRANRRAPAPPPCSSLPPRGRNRPETPRLDAAVSFFAAVARAP